MPSAPTSRANCSALGSIVGTLGTTFILIPSIGTRAITLALGIAGVLSGLALIAAPRMRRGALLLGLMLLTTPHARAEDLIDAKVRAEMLKRADGRMAHIETEYNDIYISKRRAETLTPQRR